MVRAIAPIMWLTFLKVKPGETQHLTCRDSSGFGSCTSAGYLRIVGCLCTRRLLVYLSAACTADHLPIHSSPFVRRDRGDTQRNTNPKALLWSQWPLAGKTNSKKALWLADKYKEEEWIGIARVILLLLSVL
jgi:hypothetical protein